jgi:proton glutamate symport protein
MFGLKLHWWVLIGIGVGVLAGLAMHHAHYDRIALQARVEVLGPAYAEDPQAFAAQERTRGRDIQKQEEALLRQTASGGAADALARMFLRLLNMIVLPLVFSSLVCGVLGLGDPRRLGRLGGRAMLWYASTSLLAILTGLLLVNLIRPGEGLRIPFSVGDSFVIATPESGWEVLINMVPDNIFRAAAQFELFPIIVFALLFGIFAVLASPATRSTIERFFTAIFEVMMKMTLFILALAPIGIAALIAKLVALSGPELFWQMRWYVITVALALLIHFCLTLPGLLYLLTRRNAFRMLRPMSPALLTGFSTASSSGTLPLTIERLEGGVGVSNKVTSFVLPLGATVNMDGTALYECVATIFVAQLYAAANPDFTLTIGMQVTIVMLALMVSIGAAGIPSAGLVMMVIIFKAVGLPLDLVGLLWAVDRLLDMCRTSVNIWSDVIGATAIAHHEGELDPTALFHPAPQPEDLVAR